MKSNLRSSVKERSPKLSILTDKVNVMLLCMLKAGPSYPRRLSYLVGIDESHVSERLKKLEKAGFLEAKWARIYKGNGYANVRQYSLKSDKIILSFTPSGVEVKIENIDEKNISVAIPYYNSEIPKVSTFVGREAELRFLQNTPGMKVVWGIAGIGKTTLVSMHALRLNVPVFWHQVKQVDSLSYVLSKLAVFLNLQGRSLLLDLINSNVNDERALLETALNEMSESNALFVFDDFQRSMDSGIHELLSSMAERGINSVVITRQKLHFPNSFDLKVEGLSVKDSAELMKKLGCNPSKEIISKTHGHPLLINLGCMADKPAIDDFIKETIFESLSNDALSILLPISVFRGKINMSAVQSVTERFSIGSIVSFIMKMEKIGVITSSGNEFELHPLIRDSAYAQLQNAEEVHKKAGYFYYRKGSSRDKLESLYHFILGKEDKMAIEVLGNFASFVDEGYGDVLINMLEDLPATYNSRLAAWILLAEGSAMRLLSMGMEPAKRKLEESIKRAEEAGDDKAKALAMNNLGIIYRELGEIKQAKELYHKALKAKDLDPLVISRITYNLAEAELEEGEFSSALKRMKKSMKLDFKYHDMRGYYVSRLNIDYIRFLLGQFDGLLEDLRDAAEKLKKLGLKSLLGYCYLHMAYTLIGMNSSLEEVLEYMNLALEQYVDTGFKYMQAYTLAEMVIIKVKMGKIDDAAQDIVEVKKILNKIEDMDVLGNVELALAVLFLATENFPESEAHLDRCLALFSKDWVSAMRVKAWKGILYGLNKDVRGIELLSDVSNQLHQKGCNVFVERLKACSEQLMEGSWEKLCLFLI